MKMLVEPMELEDIPQVLDVDRESYTLPWPASAYRREVLHNRNARYIVLRELPANADHGGSHSSEQRSRLPLPFLRWTRNDDGKLGRPGVILGYAGMWLMVDEAHITTIAIRTTWRGRGFGELLLISLIRSAIEVGAERITLEVRVSNEPAQQLYRKYGFVQEGTRQRYYSDNNEDAYIMTTSNIQDLGYQHRTRELTRRLQDRLRAESPVSVEAPPFLGLKDVAARRGE
jgi:[ribosomal protein S18]-alanine N-acetyltransferase